MENNPKAILLLTYKGKILLMHKQSGVLDKQKHPWGLISIIKEKSQTFEESLIKLVRKEMGIKIENIEQVTEFYFHARLTDDNVNQIVRSEHQLLDFFTIKETNKLLLSSETEKYLSSHAYLV